MMGRIATSGSSGERQQWADSDRCCAMHISKF
jgi:hypothetical protein